MSAGESRFVAEGALVAMRQSFFSLALLAAIFPGPTLAQFKSWSKEQRTFERGVFDDGDYSQTIPNFLTSLPAVIEASKAARPARPRPRGLHRNLARAPV